MLQRAWFAGKFLLLSLFGAGALAALVAAQGLPSSTEQLRSGFLNPPPTAYAHCYWWWLRGNTTAAAITRDLEGMKAKGIAGAILVDADGSGEQGNREVADGPAIGSPAWNTLYVHALAEAQRLGLEISLNVTSRWNVGIIGGETVTPQDALKQIAWARVEVNGGAERSIQLPQPSAINNFYRPIAVLAYPLRHGVPLPGREGSGRAAIPDLLFKSATLETGFSMPREEKVFHDRPSVAGEEDARTDEVVELTSHVNSAGNLVWQFPAGKWEVLVLGYTDTPKKLLDGALRAHGLPLDALSAESFDHYWQQVVLPLLEAGKPYLGTSLRYLVTDSWEAGGANWTANFRDEFRKRRGYDPVPYLPIVTGRILTSRAASEGFLFDLRRTVADLIAENYYDRFAKRAAGFGLGIHPEAGGPHGAPIDALENFRSASFPQTEYWVDSGWHRVTDDERFFVKEAASAAHIYGKRLVAAEGPTSMSHAAWSEALASNVQPTIDRAFTEGLNRLFWHEFTSSPAEYGKPGQEYFAGTHLNPNVTWWPQAAPFLRAVNRAQYLLQQGQPVSDVLYFYGNQVPDFVRVKNDDPAHVLPGYDYDVTGEDALLRRMQIEGGDLVTAEGVRYRALVLPANGHISTEALRWVEQFVAAGGTVMGVRPAAPLGLTAPDALERYHRTANALWAGCTPGVLKAAYRKGSVVCTANAHEGLSALGMVQDFTYQTSAADSHPATNPVLDFVHRTTGAAEIYFVRNTQPHAVQATISFRVDGRKPELWSVDDGSKVAVELYRATDDHRTEIPLTFPAFGSVFVVFSEAAGKHLTQLQRNGVAVYPSIRQGSEVFYTAEGVAAAAPGSYAAIDSDGRHQNFTVASPENPLHAAHWTLGFPAGWGAPSSVPVKAFESWTQSTDPGVRYFSGTATYRTTVKLPQSALGQSLWLNLGDVREIATVRVNGQEVGTVWRAPYVVRIDPWLRAGANTVEIDVSNLWPNRLIGDLQPGVTKRYAQTNNRAYRANSPLLPSGILQPVGMEQAVRLNWSR